MSIRPRHPRALSIQNPGTCKQSQPSLVPRQSRTAKDLVQCAEADCTIIAAARIGSKQVHVMHAHMHVHTCTHTDAQSHLHSLSHRHTRIQAAHHSGGVASDNDGE